MGIQPMRPTKMARVKSSKSKPKPKKDCLQTKQKPNRITCRITDTFRIQSRFAVTLLSATKPWCQSTIDTYSSRRRSKELQQGRDSCVRSVKSYQEVIVHLEAVYQDTHRESTEKSTGESTKSSNILLKPPIRSATMKSRRSGLPKTIA